MFYRRILLSSCSLGSGGYRRLRPLAVVKACQTLQYIPKITLIARRLSSSAASVNDNTSHSDCGKGCCCGTTICWKCHKPISKCTFFCTHGKCNAIQSINTSDDECNFFELLDMPVSFRLDKVQMETNLKNLQKKLHPDVYATKSNLEKEASTSCSSAVNQAYQTLSSPMDRTAYLLSLRGINVLTEDSDLSHSAAGSGGNLDLDDKESAEYMRRIMMATFLMREQVEDCSSAEEYQRLTTDLSKQIEAAEDRLQRAWDQNDTTELIKAAIAMKYASKGMEELLLKEDKYGVLRT